MMSCINEILKIKGDKKVLMFLDNNGAPITAVEGGGKYKAHEYLVVLNNHAFRCGYVAVHPGHPANLSKTKELDYEALDIRCHGGLTFGSNDHPLKSILSKPCTDIWIGFDCGHCGDKCDIETFENYYGQKAVDANKIFFDEMRKESIKQTVRTYDYVVDECKSIIDQLIEIDRYEDSDIR